MVLIAEFAGPPPVQLNTDPLGCRHYAGGGDRKRGKTKQMPRVGKKGVFFPLEEFVIEIPTQFRRLRHGP